jgi:DNA repair ATPase RecN
MPAKRIYVFAITAALGATLAAPLTFAEKLPSGPHTAAQSEIAKRLDSFESTAAELQNQTDHYAALVRANKPQRESHSRELSYAKEKINYLGRQLGELEKLSPEGTPLQQRAIEEARLHLQAVADHVQSAILMLNEDNRSHLTPEFKQTVSSINEQADNLYTKVDAITDYEKAQNRAMDAKARSES